MVLVRAEAHLASDADNFLNAFAALLPQDKEFEVIGPMPAPLDKSRQVPSPTAIPSEKTATVCSKSLNVFIRL